ncbi:alanyl-tRNA synthetase [Pilobolus umbonatus]|nr:alanyl-tRNA synthetase [Pilobolus umbonatus]
MYRGLPKYFQSTRFYQTRFIRHLTSPELRTTFTRYFEKNGHTVVESASLVPHKDKTLLFTNAGMVPFKEYFMKPSLAPFPCATTVQKCMRAGGKHNDLDNVGYTPRHHTFFEMLGNFSFGHYTKADAISYAWKFLLEELSLPVHRLRVTILEGDREAYALWKQQGLTDEMIVSCGPEDNFWSMGDGEGPCGSCTEIFWDTQDEMLDDRWVEIWNLVFMEKYRTAEGGLTDLPVPCIDTGMGLERMAAILQGKKNNFQIDQFDQLIGGLRQLLRERGLSASTDVDPSAHEKIIADHFRAMCFLIGDGVVPSNTGRGYVLRRIIRRALRSAKQIGLNEPFLTELYPSLLQCFQNKLYPELETRASSIRTIITNEETAFLSTLERGLTLLESVFKQPDLQETKEIPPNIAFKLFDTYGFPFDLTLIIARERGWTVDIKEWKNMNIKSQFTGYDHNLLYQESEILAVDTFKKGKGVQVNMAIDPCPFYGLGGGQVPDQGTITLMNASKWNVVDVSQPYEGGIALRLSPILAPGEDINQRIESDREYLQRGHLVRTEIDLNHRQGTEVHHTATHLLNAGLRRILNSNDIVQAGSTVEAKKLRFDFTYGKPLGEKELDQIESWVNEMALQGGNTQIEHLKLSEAMNSGAIASFSEKYGEDVRIVSVPGVSKEFCGGTHVDNIQKLYPFKILSETSVAAGTRRIEAVAGLACVDWYRQAYKPIPDVLKILRANGTNDMVAKLEKMVHQTKSLQKSEEFIKDKLAMAGDSVTQLFTSKMNDTDVNIHLIDFDLDAAFMQKRANVLKSTQADKIHVLVNGKIILVALNNTQITSKTANTVLKGIFKQIRGGGGGQKELAQGYLAEPIFTKEDVISKIIPAIKSVS